MINQDYDCDNKNFRKCDFEDDVCRNCDRVLSSPSKLQGAIKQIIDKTQDLDDFIMDYICQVYEKHNVKLSNNEIKDLCDYYFNKERTNERLEKANKLYTELDHINNSLTNPTNFKSDEKTVRLSY